MILFGLLYELIIIYYVEREKLLEQRKKFWRDRRKINIEEKKNIKIERRKLNVNYEDGVKIVEVGRKYKYLVYQIQKV